MNDDLALSLFGDPTPPPVPPMPTLDLAEEEAPSLFVVLAPPPPPPPLPVPATLDRTLRDVVVGTVEVHPKAHVIRHYDDIVAAYAWINLDPGTYPLVMNHDGDRTYFTADLTGIIVCCDFLPHDPFNGRTINKQREGTREPYTYEIRYRNLLNEIVSRGPFLGISVSLLPEYAFLTSPET